MGAHFRTATYSLALRPPPAIHHIQCRNAGGHATLSGHLERFRRKSSLQLLVISKPLSRIKEWTGADPPLPGRTPYVSPAPPSTSPLSRQGQPSQLVDAAHYYCPLPPEQRPEEALPPHGPHMGAPHAHTVRVRTTRLPPHIWYDWKGLPEAMRPPVL